MEHGGGGGRAHVENLRDSPGWRVQPRAGRTGTAFASRPSPGFSTRRHSVIRTRGAFGDTVLSIGALTLLVGLLMTVNGQVRQEVMLRMTSAREQSDAARLVTSARNAGAALVAM